MSFDVDWAPDTATEPASDYAAFLDRKTHAGAMSGFRPTFDCEKLFDFQRALVGWAVQIGRGAVLADCGLGKTPMQLAWAQNVVQHTNGRVLILTPLAVGAQTVAEGEKFGVACARSRDGAWRDMDRIIVTNYEKLHLFSASDFAGVVCDESSILKHFRGVTQQQVTRWLTKVPYRLLATATAAPNDYIELGTSSEALGYLGYSDMLSRFFRQAEGTTFHRLHEMKKRHDINADAALADKMERMSYRVGQTGQWRLKGHAVTPFWQWVASWARACRKPSDLGFSDDGFVLPPMTEREHVVIAKQPRAGMLFEIPATTLDEEREERRRTLGERVERAAALVAHDKPAVVWCHMNAEGNALERAIPSAIQIAGSDSDEAKEERYAAFQSGQARVLIIKPKIGAWGLNWQHCAHVVTFASHSYEQYYQSIRRCWRFGQQSPVTVDIIYTEGEQRVRENMSRKARAADYMFAELVTHMNAAMRVDRARHQETIEVPTWLTR